MSRDTTPSEEKGTEPLPRDNTSQRLKTIITGRNITEFPTQRIGTTVILGQNVQDSTGRAPSNLYEAEALVPAEWNTGDVIIGLYEVTDVFSGGATAMVYKVYHREWHMDLAVKTPKPAILAGRRGAENFEHEAQTWVNLGLHPHIVSCYYVRRLGGIPRLFAEYVNGGDLAGWIRNRSLYEGGHAQALERILDVAIQCAWGLQYAHEQGLIHQDVKPANILITREGIAKVTDFGLAKARAATHEDLLDQQEHNILVTCSGMTPAYCSPEQAAILQRVREGVAFAQRGKLTLHTDIWSWAVLVLEMFTGRVTWVMGDHADAALERYLTTGPEEHFLPLMPGDIAELLRQCLKQHPQERSKSMQEVSARLQMIYKKSTGQAYARLEPRPAEALADSLNNRAVSLVDLWQMDKAEQYWEDALKVQPLHPESTYNRGLLRWRSGKLCDDELLRELEEVRQSGIADRKNDYLLGLVHLERGDYESAARLFAGPAEDAGRDMVARDARSAAVQNMAFSKKLFRTFTGHSNAVNAVCLSADGRYALSGSGAQFSFGRDKDYTLRLWDVPTGKCLRTFEGHTARVASVFLSRDGTLALSGSVDATVKLWQVETGECLHTFEGHGSVVNAVCATRDDRYGVSGSRDGTLKLWELQTGQCLRTFSEHTDKITALCCSEDGLYLLSGSGDTTLKLWEIETGECLRTFSGHGAGVTSVALSTDGQLALSGSEDTTLKLWEVQTGQCLRTITGNSENIFSVSLSSDSSYALSGGGDLLGKEWLVRLWEVLTGRCLFTFSGHTARVTSVCFSLDGSCALSGSEDMTLKLWQVSLTTNPWQAPMMLATLQKSEETVAAQLRYRHAMDMARAALDQDNIGQAVRHLKDARSQKGYGWSKEAIDLWSRLYVRLPKRGFNGWWDGGSFKGHKDSVRALCLSADDTCFVSGGEDAIIRLWDIRTGNRLLTCEGHTGGVFSVAMSSDKRYIVSGSGDARVKLWDVESGRCLATRTGHTASVYVTCISPDGRFAASGSEDATIRIWSMPDGTCLQSLHGHAYAVTSLCVSPDGRFIVSGSTDTTIRLWETATGRCVRIFEGRLCPVTAVCFSHDGRTVISGGDNGKLKLWDLETGSCTRSFEGHTGKVTVVCLSMDGRFILSGSEDRTIRVWDIAAAACLRTLEGHAYAVTSLCISRNGCFALSGSRDQTIKMWVLDWELEEHDPADWNDGARPHLETFLTVHMPYADMLSTTGTLADAEKVKAHARQGRPKWDEIDFNQLLYTLGCAGYGWLRPESIQKKVHEMARSWTGPPPLIHIFEDAQGERPKRATLDGPEGKKTKKRSSLKLDID